MARLSIQDLLRPEAFPHEVRQLQLRETHISWVVLTGLFVYKIKKPVKLDFIDASTLELRRHYCSEELRLNRRLAPDLYLDVVPIASTSNGVVVNKGGPAIEYAVRMRQFATADELPKLLAAHRVDVSDMTVLGELLARFHLQSAVAPPGNATSAVYDSVLGNAMQLTAHAGPLDASARLDDLVVRTQEALHVLSTTFQLRQQDGFVRECHGDLHAANVVRLQGRLLPFDCIEFDPALRWIDVINDISFLVMDLMARERPDLAFAMLSRYLEVTGDYEGVRLLPFYAAYRALVRAKIDALSAEHAPDRAEDFRNRLQRRIRIADHWMQRRAGALVIMHGPSGSGKSWLSERLVQPLSAIRIRSDVERKRLAGIDVADSASAEVAHGIYSPQFSRRTYSRLVVCAEACCRAGVNVIVDAAFLDSSERERFRAVAERTAASYVIVSCQADRATLAARIRERDLGQRDASDASLVVLDDQLSRMQPFDAGEQQYVVSFDAREGLAIQHVIAEIAQRSRTAG